jgi:hypothetical protein
VLDDFRTNPGQIERNRSQIGAHPLHYPRWLTGFPLNPEIRESEKSQGIQFSFFESGKIDKTDQKLGKMLGYFKKMVSSQKKSVNFKMVESAPKNSNMK